MAQNLLLLPGTFCSSRLFQHQIQRLKGNYEIKVVSDYPSSTTMKDCASFVLSQAPTKFNLLGHSFGGYVAMEILRQAPERISKLILMSTQARGDTEQIKKTRINNIEQVQGRGLEHFIDQLSLFLKETNHEVMKTVSEMCHETGEITYVNQQKSSMSREDSRALLKSTKIPVLFIVGRNDQVTPLACTTEMKKLIPHCKVEIIENCGHFPTLEQPEIVTNILQQWLQQ